MDEDKNGGGGGHDKSGCQIRFGYRRSQKKDFAIETSVVRNKVGDVIGVVKRGLIPVSRIFQVVPGHTRLTKERLKYGSK